MSEIQKENKFFFLFPSESTFDDSQRYKENEKWKVKSEKWKVKNIYKNLLVSGKNSSSVLILWLKNTNTLDKELLLSANNSL